MGMKLHPREYHFYFNIKVNERPVARCCPCLLILLLLS